MNLLVAHQEGSHGSKIYHPQLLDTIEIVRLRLPVQVLGEYQEAHHRRYLLKKVLES